MRHNYEGDEGAYANLALLRMLPMTTDALAIQERLAEAGFRKLKTSVHLPDTWGGLDDQLAARTRESLAEWRESTTDGATTA